MLYLSAIILSFFLFFVLATKKRKSTGDKILVAWLITIGIHLVVFYIFSTKQYTDHPWFILPGFALPFAHAPFLYLYTVYQVRPRRFKKMHLLHFLPVLLSLAMFGNFLFLSHAQQLEVIASKGKGYGLQTAINLAAIFVSGLVYIPLSLYTLVQYRRTMVHRFSNTEKINFNWLLYLVLWLVVIWTVLALARNDEWTFGFVAVFIAWLGYFGIKQVKVFSEQPATVTLQQHIAPPETEEPPTAGDTGGKYQKPALGETEATELHRRLLALMNDEQPWKNPDLTLTDLAKPLGVHPNVLSQVINSKENKTFYDLVNEQRVQEFIRLSTGSGGKQYTLLSLAFDCGFNSKASFNRNFKKYTGQTPSAYMKQVPGEVSSAM